MSADGKTTGQRVISQFLETHRGQNSRVEPGIPVPVDKCTRPDPTRDNDDPTRPAGNGSGRVYPRVGSTRKPLVTTTSQQCYNVSQKKQIP